MNANPSAVVTRHDAAVIAASARHSAAADRLTTAMSTSQFRVVYQPIVKRLADGRWHADQVEALIRWRDARGRWIDPERTVALAESHGLLLALTVFVLEQSVTQLRRWDDAGVRLDLAVNVLPATLIDGNLSAAMTRLADRHAIDLSRVTLEVSEAYPIEDLELARRAVRALHAIGARCSIDDIGLRYSTLWRAEALGVDQVKIDRCIIEQAPSGTEIDELVRSWIEQAHCAGMEVTAEGVSDLAILKYVDDTSIDRMQGFFISRPIEGINIGECIRSWNAGPNAASAQHNLQMQFPDFDSGYGRLAPEACRRPRLVTSPRQSAN